MIGEFSVISSDLNGRLHIESTLLSSPLFPAVSQVLQSRYPSVQLNIQFMRIDQLVLGLTNFEIDIGVTYLDNPDLDQFVTMALYQEPHTCCYLIMDETFEQTGVSVSIITT